MTVRLRPHCVFYQLFIPELMHKVDNGFVHLLVLLLRRDLKSYLFPLTL
jgi:hypothetical protein